MHEPYPGIEEAPHQAKAPVQAIKNPLHPLDDHVNAISNEDLAKVVALALTIIGLPAPVVEFAKNLVIKGGPAAWNFIKHLLHVDVSKLPAEVRAQL